MLLRRGRCFPATGRAMLDSLENRRLLSGAGPAPAAPAPADQPPLVIQQASLQCAILLPQGPKLALSLQFNEDPLLPLAASDLVLHSLSAGGDVTANAVTYDASTHTGTWSVNGIPDGDYAADVPASAITDPSGNPLPADFQFDVSVHGPVFHFPADLDGMNLSIGLSASAVFDASQHLGSLTIGGSASLPAGGNRVISTSNVMISPGASLDLADNDLIVIGGAPGTWNGSGYTGVTGLVTTGFIRSSSEIANHTTLGIATAGEALGISGSQTGTFDGQTVSPSDVLVKYTYVGDANLDGKVNIDDYGRIDGNVGQSGFVFGWYNGDFNLDGKINIDDYGLIDGIIGQQGPPL